MVSSWNLLVRLFYKTKYYSAVMFQTEKYKCKPSLFPNAWIPLCEMCPKTEFFLVRIFPHSNWIRRDTSHLSVFSPNTGKCGPEKTPYLDTFHAVYAIFECNIFDHQIISSLKLDKWRTVSKCKGASRK